MSDLTAEELGERIVRSLKANSAEFARARRAQKMAPIRRACFAGLIFIAGVALGVIGSRWLGIASWLNF